MHRLIIATLFFAATATTQAQTAGSLPVYRCISADGTSSRISRAPCAVGETGTAKQAVAGTPQPKPAIDHQITSASAQSRVQDESNHRHAHTTKRSGRRH